VVAVADERAAVGAGVRRGVRAGDEDHGVGSSGVAAVAGAWLLRRAGRLVNADVLRVLEVLSQVVTCSANCGSCRAAAQELIESDVLRVERCELCTRPFAPALGECPCASFDDGNPAAAGFHGERRTPADAVSITELKQIVAVRRGEVAA
jgi:bacterioferritin-associated ferredoxin